MSYIDIVFDGPDGHEPGHFVEVENEKGHSISFGDWLKRDDECWVLRIQTRCMERSVKPHAPKPEESVFLVKNAGSLVMHKIDAKHQGFLFMLKQVIPVGALNQDVVAYCNLCWPIVIPDEQEVSVQLSTHIAHDPMHVHDAKTRRDSLDATGAFHPGDFAVLPWRFVKGNVRPCEMCWE